MKNEVVEKHDLIFEGKTSYVLIHEEISERLYIKLFGGIGGGI